MLIFRGYGFFVVLCIYGGCFWTVSKIMANAGDTEQAIAIVVAMAVATAISYLVARFLNRNGVKHTLYQIKLQSAVLAFDGVLEALAIFMLWGYIR